MTSRPSSSLDKDFCIICKKAPEAIDSYKCNMRGHILCNSCVKTHCKSTYGCPNCDSVLIKRPSSKEVTVEQLFELPTESVNRLLLNTGEKPNLEEMSKTNLNVIKPLKCPHRPCGKVINSMKTHFEHDHPDIKIYLIRKGEKLKITSNVSNIEYGMTYCIARLQLLEKRSSDAKTLDIYKPKKREPPLLWFLVSGSYETGTSEAYAVYWLLTDSDEVPFKCTIEMTSDLNTKGCAILCGVNSIHDDLSVQNIQKNLNCLYLSFGSIKNLKGLWGEVNLHVTIH